MPQPSSFPEWASAPSAEIVEPDAAKKASGWAAAEPPPHQWFNWFMNLVYAWIVWLAGNESTGRFSSLASLVDELGENEVGVVSGEEVGNPFDIEWSYQHPADVKFVVGDGVRVYVATDDFVYAHDAATGALLWTYPGSALLTVQGLDTDGENVFIHEGGPSPQLYQIAADTGATVNSIPDPFLSSGPIQCDGAYVYVAKKGGPAPQYDTIHRWANGLAGVPDSYILGEPIFDFAVCDGEWIYSTCDFSANGTTIAATYIPTGSTATYLAFTNNGVAVDFDGEFVVFSNEDETFIHPTETSGGGLPVLSPDANSRLVAATRIAASPHYLARLYVAGGPLYVVELARNPRGFGRLHTAALDVGAAPMLALGGVNTINDVELDSFRLFYGGAQQVALAGSPTLVAYNLKKIPKTFRRVASGDTHRGGWRGIAVEAE